MQEERTRGINPESGAASAAEIQNYLRGVDYPATKDDLVSKAREQGAPQEVVNKLEEMPDEEYGGPQDLMKRFREEQ